MPFLLIRQQLATVYIPIFKLMSKLQMFKFAPWFFAYEATESDFWIPSSSSKSRN